MRGLRDLLNLTGIRKKTRATICSAIKSRRIIEFYYHGGYRLVEPFCLGLIMSGEGDNESLLCYQIGGYSELREVVGWKLYRASEMENIEISNESFTGDRTGYDPDSVEMVKIYCCVDMYKETGGNKVEIPTLEMIIPSQIGELFPRSDTGVLQNGATQEVKAKPKKVMKQFSSSYIRMIKIARRLNRNRRISGEIYFYPIERNVVVKSIDLSRSDPLNEVSVRPRARLKVKDRSHWKKKWLEAYIISKAKKNDWKFKLEKNEYSYLLSQLRFGRDASNGEKCGGVLDLLLYNDEKQYLAGLQIILKPDKVVLDTAISELSGYVEKMKEGIEAGFFAAAFGLEEIKGLFVYILCPRQDISYDPNKYGIIEFDSFEDPCTLYKEIGHKLEVGFYSKRGALNLLKHNAIFAWQRT